VPRWAMNWKGHMPRGEMWLRDVISGARVSRLALANINTTIASCKIWNTHYRCIEYAMESDLLTGSLSPQIFTKFPSLPSEFRLRIWELAAVLLGKGQVRDFHPLPRFCVKHAVKFWSHTPKYSVSISILALIPSLLGILRS
jgi:hypothetical protein